MMDYIRQLRVAGRQSWTQAGTGGSSRPGPSPGGLRVDWVGAAGEAERFFRFKVRGLGFLTVLS